MKIIQGDQTHDMRRLISGKRHAPLARRPRIQEDARPLTPSGKLVVQQLHRNRGPMTATELSLACGFVPDASHVRKILKTAMAAGLVQKRRVGKGFYWSMTPAGIEAVHHDG